MCFVGSISKIDFLEFRVKEFVIYINVFYLVEVLDSLEVLVVVFFGLDDDFVFCFFWKSGVYENVFE